MSHSPSRSCTHTLVQCECCRAKGATKVDRYVIAGGRPLCGTVKVQGAKNSALPTIAACLLTEEPVRLRNIPKLTDISAMCSILHSLGAECEWDGDDLVVSAERISSCVIPDELMREIRSSIILMGPLLARSGRVIASDPGGCGNTTRSRHSPYLAECRCDRKHHDGGDASYRRDDYT